MSENTATRPRPSTAPPPPPRPPAPPRTGASALTRPSAAEIGRAGEELAATYLQRSGFQVLERNVHLRTGEIDIVALDGATLVFIEVKTRRTLVTGVPQAAVTPAKLRRLRSLVGAYLMDASPPHRDIRIDVVAVLAHADGTFAVEHLRGVG